MSLLFFKNLGAHFLHVSKKSGTFDLVDQKCSMKNIIYPFPIFEFEQQPFPVYQIYSFKTAILTCSDLLTILTKSLENITLQNNFSISGL